MNQSPSTPPYTFATFPESSSPSISAALSPSSNGLATFLEADAFGIDVSRPSELRFLGDPRHRSAPLNTEQFAHTSSRPVTIA